MKLLIKIFVFIIFTKSLAKIFSFEDVCLDHDSNVLFINKITITKKTTNFLSFFEIVVLTQIRVSIKNLCNIVFVEKDVSDISSANIIMNQRNNI